MSTARGRTLVLVLVLAAAAWLPIDAARPQDSPARFAPTPLLPIEDLYPHVSAVGRVVFQSNRSGGTHLFTSTLDGEDVRQLTSGKREDRTPKWSPDGKRIAFAATLDGEEDVWIVDADGRSARNITRHPGSDSHPSWSPDGRQIVFCSTRGDDENDDVYVMDADGANLRRITDNGLHWDTFPSFSPDGRRILFRRLLRQRDTEATLFNSEVMVMDRDGTNAVNLTRSAFFDGWPAWSPDGRQIAFSSNRSDVYQLYVMNADGSGVVQVVESTFTDVRPQWLPDGSGLLFNREHDGRSGIWRVRLAKTP